MIKNGIDVSKHQGKIDWTKVKTDFAIIRAGFGRDITQKDPYFETNYVGCKAANIPVGSYWYSYAMSADEAKKEAEICLEIIKGKSFEYPIYFDIEEPKQLALGKQKCSEIAKVFLETVESAGYWVGIYSSKSHLETYIAEEIRKRFAVWVAHYGVEKTTYNGNFGIWQKSSAGKISGINGNVDLNECYVDYPQQIKTAGLNGLVSINHENPGYTVKNGDTLWAIASKFLGSGSRYKEIMTLNNLASDVIFTGQILKIPEK